MIYWVVASKGTGRSVRLEDTETSTTDNRRQGGSVVGLSSREALFFAPPAPEGAFREGARSLKTKQHVRSGVSPWPCHSAGRRVRSRNASRFDSRRLGLARRVSQAASA